MPFLFMYPNVEINDDAAHNHHAYKRLVGISHDKFLVFADEVTDIGEDGHPDACSHQGIKRELEVVHPGKSRRK